MNPYGWPTPRYYRHSLNWVVGALIAGMVLIAIAAALVLATPSRADDYVVTKTTKWSLTDRVAQALCESERDDCEADWRCGPPDHGTQACITVGVTGSAAVWTTYRARAQRLLDDAKRAP